jgi:hypothetical protein
VAWAVAAAVAVATELRRLEFRVWPMGRRDYGPEWRSKFYNCLFESVSHVAGHLTSDGAILDIDSAALWIGNLRGGFARLSRGGSDRSWATIDNSHPNGSLWAGYLPAPAAHAAPAAPAGF